MVQDVYAGIWRRGHDELDAADMPIQRARSRDELGRTEPQGPANGEVAWVDAVRRSDLNKLGHPIAESAEAAQEGAGKRLRRSVRLLTVNRPLGDVQEESPCRSLSARGAQIGD